MAMIQCEFPVRMLTPHGNGLDATVQVPQVHVTLAVHRAEDCWMRRVPAHVVHVVLEVVDGQNGPLRLLHRPQLHAPIEGRRHRQVAYSFNAMLFHFAPRVHVEPGDRPLVAIVNLGDADLLAMDVALAHRAILRADVKLVGLGLRKRERHDGQVFTALGFVLKVDGLLRQCQHSERPNTQAAIVRGRDQVCRVLRADLLHRLNRMRMPLAAQRRPLYRAGFGTSVP
mmetsp:Transcript_39312/g.108435  ORF Transcript_39312/g.108435 Transcript_39312/m.108435 type:complete len:227 (+) Transcript_39312:450-1130(+)